MRSVSLFAVMVVLAGCASSAAPAAKPAAAPTVVNAVPAAIPPGTVRRSDVLSAVSSGLGAFLQYVTIDVDHPVIRNRKFFGFRILTLNGDWNGIDLKPGDVVTSVNGLPIERPEQAQEAFASSALVNEITAEYERDGQMHTLRVPIIDE